MNNKKQIAIEILATGQDISKAAELSNVSRPTLYKWINDPDFKRELAKRQGEMIQHLSAKYLSLGDEVIDAIRAGLNDRSISTRLRAAAIHGSKYQSYIEPGLLEQRIASLEARTTRGKHDKN